MFFPHSRLKISGRQVFGVGLVRAPLHEEAVADTAQQAQDEHGRGGAHPAAVIIVGNVQALVQTIFDTAKAGLIELQPALRIELLGWRAG
jgi:hypothetical protein